MDLRTARKRAGLSQEQLAVKAGIEQSNISALESGSRPLGERLAERLAQHVPAYAPELVVKNRVARLSKALDTGDKVGALEECLVILKTCQPYEHHFDEDFKRDLTRLANYVSKFAAGDFDEDYDDFDDGRDFHGRRIRPLDRHEVFDYGEDYDDFDDGRDIHGLRIRPLRESD